MVGLASIVDRRQVLEGILYVLRTGCQWNAAPAEFGAPSTLHNYFQEWTDKKVFFRLWKEALREYDALEGIGWGWQSVDGAMTKAPLGGEKNAYLGQCGHAGSTIAAYRHVAGHFARWLAERKISLRRVDEATVRAFTHRHLPQCRIAAHTRQSADRVAPGAAVRSLLHQRG